MKTYNLVQRLERKETAEGIKNIRRLLNYRNIRNMWMLEEKKIQSFYWLWIAITITITLSLIVVLSTPAQAESIEGYSIVTWIEAIHKAERNDNYGILSVSCIKGEACKKVCARTVRNNYHRWLKTEQNISFLHFLGQRYCPNGAANDPTGLNQNWEKNVQWFLNHPKVNIIVR